MGAAQREGALGQVSLAMLRANDPELWPALMAQSQAGDADAYRRLLNGIVPYLRTVVSRSLRQYADVEDTVQDILLTVHAVRHTYDPGRPFRPWLIGIARHRIIDRLRARGRVAAYEVQVDVEGVDGTEPPASDEMDRRALQAGLAGLPERQREAITLLKLQEMSLHEASALTGQSVAALKVSTHRGLKALRRLFRKRDDNP
jgi:RNA polymerase sigma-70 factor (ECF subfamily)